MEWDSELEGGSQENTISAQSQLEESKVEETRTVRTTSKQARVFDTKVVIPDKHIENILSFILTEELLREINNTLSSVHLAWL
jgi:hypothetical protein